MQIGNEGVERFRRQVRPLRLSGPGTVIGDLTDAVDDAVEAGPDAVHARLDRVARDTILVTLLATRGSPSARAANSGYEPAATMLPDHTLRRSRRLKLAIIGSLLLQFDLSAPDAFCRQMRHSSFAGKASHASEEEHT